MNYLFAFTFTFIYLYIIVVIYYLLQSYSYLPFSSYIPSFYYPYLTLPSFTYIQDSFGARLISAGVKADTIRAWSVDPQVKGKSLFDQLEDMDADDCIAKAVELAK